MLENESILNKEIENNLVKLTNICKIAENIRFLLENKERLIIKKENLKSFYNSISNEKNRKYMDFSYSISNNNGLFVNLNRKEIIDRSNKDYDKIMLEIKNYDKSIKFLCKQYIDIDYDLKYLNKFGVNIIEIVKNTFEEEFA